jgi:hypothetical protein
MSTAAGPDSGAAPGQASVAPPPILPPGVEPALTVTTDSREPPQRPVDAVDATPAAVGLTQQALSGTATDGDRQRHPLPAAGGAAAPRAHRAPHPRPTTRRTR